MTQARGEASRYLRTHRGKQDRAVQALRDRMTELERTCTARRRYITRLQAELTRLRNAGIDVLAALQIPDLLPDALDELQTALEFHLAQPEQLPEKVKRARIRMREEGVVAHRPTA